MMKLTPVLLKFAIEEFELNFWMEQNEDETSLSSLLLNPRKLRVRKCELLIRQLMGGFHRAGTGKN